MRRLTRRLLAVLVALIFLIVAVVIQLQPPRPLNVPPQGATLADVTVINPLTQRLEHQTIAIAGSKIESITPVPKSGVAAGQQTYAGTYVLPGLIDMHVHHPPAIAATDIRVFEIMYLAHGVTAVRDTGNFDGSILKTRAQILDGAMAGPRIFACGPIIDGDPPVWPGSRVVHSAAEAERAVDEIAATGVHCIKAYQNLNLDELRGIEAAAARHNLPVIGHVPLAVPFEQAHLADVQHLTGVPNAPTLKTTPVNWVEMLASAWANTDPARIDFIVRTSVDQKIIHTPTLVVWQRIAALADYDALARDPDAAMLPAYYRDTLWRPGGIPNMPVQNYAALAPQLDKMKTVVRKLHEAGVLLHVGTDTINPFVVPGAALLTELRNFADCGFTPEEAWAAATRQNGESLPEPGLGTIAAGAPADLLVFGEDPTHDLSSLSTLEAVIANGRLYTKEQLDDALEGYRGYFASWLYNHVAIPIARMLVRLAPSPSTQTNNRTT